jgi:iron(II)-dependent oxidoreductase
VNVNTPQHEPAPQIVTPQGITLILIPAGKFLAGGTNERDGAFEVFLPAYYIAKCPVTRVQYKEFGAATGYLGGYCLGSSEGDNYPVTGVSWSDAQQYCSWCGLRLPTELEWV